MDPVHATPNDIQPYYLGSWLMHKKEGPCHVVRILGTDPVEVRLINAGGFTKQCKDLTELSAMWLRPGSYEMSERAFYLTRVPVRSRQRSMSIEHYVPTFLPNSLDTAGREELIWAALKCQNLRRTLPEALSLLATGKESVVVNTDLIVASPTMSAIRGYVPRVDCGPPNSVYAVVVRGEPTGLVVNGTFLPAQGVGGMQYKMTRLLLEREGLTC